MFSSSVALKWGIATILEEGNPHLRKGSVVVPLQQRQEDLGLLTSFDVEIEAGCGRGLFARGRHGTIACNRRDVITCDRQSTGVAGVSSPGIVEAPPEYLQLEPLEQHRLAQHRRLMSLDRHHLGSSERRHQRLPHHHSCLLYTSDAADE